MKRLYLLCILLFPCFLFAQQYTGLSGLIHIPSADMHPAGEARVGGHFLNREFLPNEDYYRLGTYHTGTYYLSVTPFSWMELAYTCTMVKIFKGKEDMDPKDVKYTSKDRYFSIKLRPLKEGKYWPSIAVGTNDPITTIEGKNQFFGNYFIAATKHISVKGHIFAAHLAYRHWKRDFNFKWNGVVGGVTYQPSFQQNLRVIAEYTGADFNVGFDWKLWKHVLIQASLQDGKYFSGGLCFCLNLL